MDNGFDLKKIAAASESANKQKPSANLGNYNEEMTISQVVRFFERQGLSFTKTMIQNYVRSNVIPPPREKRYYTRLHLLLLALVDSLKDVYSLEEMRGIFSSFVLPVQEFERPDMYQLLMALYGDAVVEWAASVPTLAEQASHIARDMQVREEERDRVEGFVTLLMIMAQSVAAKKTIRTIIEDTTP